MTPIDLKALDKMIALCRKRGVKSFKIDNIEIVLSDEVPAPRTRKSKSPGVQATSKYPTGDSIQSEAGLTEEQLLFYSVANHIENEESPESNQ